MIIQAKYKKKNVQFYRNFNSYIFVFTLINGAFGVAQ